MTKMEKARLRLLLSQPFFATVLYATPCVESDRVPTAGTDMKTIWFNPKFMDGLSLEHCLFVFAHEVMHIVLMHGLRRGNRDATIWNIACDFAINLILKDSKLDMPPDGLLDEKYRDMSAEQIYDDLIKNAERVPASGFMSGDLQEPDDVNDPAARSVIERRVQQQIATAATMARLAGNMPGSLDALITALLNPKVPWQQVLRDYMTRQTKDDESWARRNRRFADIVLPARHSFGLDTIAFIGDVSGSVSDDEINQVAAEVRDVATTMHPEKIWVLWADMVVQKEEWFEVNDPIELHPRGRGGTDMRVPLARVAEEPPQVCVLVTDGHTPWPDVPPDYPLIVCCTTNVEVPIGQVIRITS
jgi:predicted metal-dependent peptidase